MILTPRQQQEVHEIITELKQDTLDLVYEAGQKLADYGVEPCSSLMNLVGGIGSFAVGYFDKCDNSSALKELLLACLRGALMGHDIPIGEDGKQFSMPNLKPEIYRINKDDKDEEE